MLRLALYTKIVAALPTQTLAAPPFLTPGTQDIDINATDTLAIFNTTDTDLSVGGPVTCYNTNDPIFTPQDIGYVFEACVLALELLSREMQTMMEWWWVPNLVPPPGPLGRLAILPLLNQREPKACLLAMTSTLQLGAASIASAQKGSAIGWRPEWGNQLPQQVVQLFPQSKDTVVEGFRRLLDCVRKEKGEERAGHVMIGNDYKDEHLIPSSLLHISVLYSASNAPPIFVANNDPELQQHPQISTQPFSISGTSNSIKPNHRSTIPPPSPRFPQPFVP
ncbi:uncharacterized protein KY384_003951 [Bacidia gigantensis]|uniref:uncharacterized protein n=1 Tax=Bacidia gigantensis TaxID=2732470 RepID=UPI001D04570B|nr:uncharacterized protein KY384_003951 [Bacidia gigantensis]KAG8532310.1 hypothetical protein KY384_003951 [Bacidia gigantensis]